METTGKDKNVVWVLGPKQLTDSGKHCFGPWDIYCWDVDAWVLEGTYYYLEDIPKGVWSNLHKRVVPIGKEAWWLPQDIELVPKLYSEKLRIRLDKEG